MPTVSLKLFSYNQKDGSLSSELSTLEANSEIPNSEIPRVLMVESHLTKKIVQFELLSTERDREGDVQAWIYKIRPDYATLYRKLEGMTLKVFND